MAEPIYVGIDVAKDTLEVAIGSEASTQSFANDDTGHDALVSALRAHSVDLIVMESTGGYEAP